MKFNPALDIDLVLDDGATTHAGDDADPGEVGASAFELDLGANFRQQPLLVVKAIVETLVTGGSEDYVLRAQSGPSGFASVTSEYVLPITAIGDYNLPIEATDQFLRILIDKSGGAGGTASLKFAENGCYVAAYNK